MQIFEADSTECEKVVAKQQGLWYNVTRQWASGGSHAYGSGCYKKEGYDVNTT